MRDLKSDSRYPSILVMMMGMGQDDSLSPANQQLSQLRSGKIGCENTDIKQIYSVFLKDEV